MGDLKTTIVKSPIIVPLVFALLGEGGEGERETAGRCIMVLGRGGGGGGGNLIQLQLFLNYLLLSK